MSFRGKQVLLLALVAATVAIATSAIHALTLARSELMQARRQAELLAETLSHQAHERLRESSDADPILALQNDPSLRGYADAVVSYSSTVLYMVLTDADGVALFHSDPRREGQWVPPDESLAKLTEQPASRQLWSLLSGGQILVATLPFAIDVNDGTARVAISGLLLRRRVLGELTTSAGIAAGVVLLAFLGSFLLASRILAPIERLRRELARIDTGADEPLDLRSEADVHRVADFFSRIGRKLSGEAPRQAPSRMDELVEGLADAVVVVGPDGRVLSANRTARALLADPDEPDDRAVVGGPLVVTALAELADRTAAEQRELGPTTVALRGPGRDVEHSVTTTPLSLAGDAAGVVLTLRDLERLSDVGSRLSYSQKLAALGHLTSGVAHEIKNPLHSIVLELGLMREELAGDPTHERRLDTVDGEIRRLDRIVRAYLQFTRPERLELRPVELDGLLRELLERMATRLDDVGIEVELDTDDRGQVWGSEELLQQAFQNLVVNACEALPEGGHLAIRTRREDGHRIRVTVEDDGPGIASDRQSQIFDLFYTTKSGGSGVGLSVVYRVAQLHGGQVAVSSVPGEGTRFDLTLPEARA